MSFSVTIKFRFSESELEYALAILRESIFYIDFMIYCITLLEMSMLKVLKQESTSILKMIERVLKYKGIDSFCCCGSTRDFCGTWWLVIVFANDNNKAAIQIGKQVSASVITVIYIIVMLFF